MTYFVDQTARKPKEIQPGIRTRTYWKDKMLVSVVELDPNVTMEPHQHMEEQVGYMVKGSMDMTIGAERRMIKEGDLYHIPANVPHGVTAGPKGATVMDVFAPIRPVLQY